MGYSLCRTAHTHISTHTHTHTRTRACAQPKPIGGTSRGLLCRAGSTHKRTLAHTHTHTYSRTHNHNKQPIGGTKRSDYVTHNIYAIAESFLTCQTQVNPILIEDDHMWGSLGRIIFSRLLTRRSLSRIMERMMRFLQVS